MFAERLKELRIDNDMSREELAEKLDITIHSISKYERGLVLPDTARMIKICEIFNVSLDYLISNERDELTMSVYNKIKQLDKKR